MNFCVTHIYREGNKAVDSLASQAPSIESSTWWHSTPSFVSSFVTNDLVGLSNFRFC